jgi:hypothetical protein
MAVPGFSVTDLIDALGTAKKIYDAFFHKNKNAANQVKQLSEEIEQFRINLESHRETIEQHGIPYSDIQPAKKTVDEWCLLLSKYQSAIDKSFTVAGAFRTARFPFVQDDVAKLRDQIKRHENNIILQSLRIVL